MHHDRRHDRIRRRRRPPAPPPRPVPDNILLADWAGPFYDGVPPFDQVRPDLFPEAFQFAIDERRREVEAIANNPAPPTFANTVEALERAGERLDRVESVFGVMTDNMTNPDYQALEREWSPRLAAAYDELILNPALFQRVKAVYEARETSGLDAQQQRVVTRLYDQFVRRGANLSPEQKQQLSGLQPGAGAPVRPVRREGCSPTRGPRSSPPRPSSPACPPTSRRRPPRPRASATCRPASSRSSTPARRSIRS